LNQIICPLSGDEDAATPSNGPSRVGFILPDDGSITSFRSVPLKPEDVHVSLTQRFFAVIAKPT
jgi:hypothetical protein